MTVTTNPVVTGIQTGASFADPTATLGLAAVNGSATTGLRSDGAPALSQAIVPTWTGTHTFNNTIAGSVSGLAGTATALATPRAINGTNFDGTAAITVTAAAGTLTGNTLAAGVTASSLTSVGTLGSLTLAGAITGATDFTNTGNTILGNASTDTLNVGNGGLVKDASGNVGIGLTSSGSRLEVAAAGGSMASVGSVGAILSTDAVAADKGGSLGFGGNYTGSTKTNWAGIAGLKENGNDGQYGGYLALYSRADGAGMVEHMRIGSAGIITMAALPALSYASDATAAAGGVPVGGLYNTAGAVKVRLT